MAGIELGLGPMAQKLARQIFQWLAHWRFVEILTMEGSMADIAAAMKTKRTVTIERDPSTSDGTFGLLTAGLFQCYTLEPEWLNNERGFSCIPEGEYECSIVESPKFGKVYGLKTDHIKRDNVLIHWGNFAASPPKKSSSDGCVMLGRAIGEIADQPALLSSKDAFSAFMDELEGMPFVLKILWGRDDA